MLRKYVISNYENIKQIIGYISLREINHTSKPLD